MDIDLTETILASLNPNYPANTRILITAKVQIRNENDSSKNIPARNLKLKIGDTILDSNGADLNVIGGSSVNHVLMANRITATPKESFAVTALANKLGLKAHVELKTIGPSGIVAF